LHVANVYCKMRDMKSGRKPKLIPQQITDDRKMIDAGERREDVGALFSADRTTLYQTFLILKMPEVDAKAFQMVPIFPYKPFGQMFSENTNCHFYPRVL
jgi:hypothetical protein